MREFIQTQSLANIILMFWNFFGSMLIGIFSFLMFQAIEHRRDTIDNIRLFGTKIALVMLMGGSIFQAIRIEVPSVRLGFILSGVLIYLIVIVLAYNRGDNT